MKLLSLIVPAYNEEKRIGQMIKAYSNFLECKRKENKLDYEILVVINGTSDGTEEIVKAWQRKKSSIRYIDLKRSGKGYAVVESFKDALKRENDLIGFVDADMATSPEEFYKLIKNTEKHDGVIASRYLPGSMIEPKPTYQRLIAKRMFNSLVRALLFLPYKDSQCGAKLFRRKATQVIIDNLTMSQWAFDVELLHILKKEALK